MLTILVDGGPLAALQLYICDPVMSGLSNRDALIWCCVDAPTHVLSDDIVAGLSVLFAVEGLDVTTALLVDVIDNPRLFSFALRRDPFALSNRHVTLPCIGW